MLIRELENLIFDATNRAIDHCRTYVQWLFSRLELSKKKLAFLTFDQIKIVSLMLINDWGDMSEAQEPTLDREFLSSLKDIKVSATTSWIRGRP